VFSFEKLTDADVLLDPEMKSTGEVLGIGKSRDEALYKGLVAAGYKMKRRGGLLVTVRDADKAEITGALKKFADQGFTVYATKGTARTIREAGMKAIAVDKLHESPDNIMALLESGKVDYIISTSSKGKLPSRDSVKIRRKAVEMAIPCITSVDTANALADSLLSRFSQHSTELVDIAHMRKEKMRLPFVKMNGTSNDYIYFDCFQHPVESPESLSVYLSDPHGGVGGDGVILICPSDVADAKMRIFNRDGSEGKMCGNGIRCVGKYLYDGGYAEKEELTIETLSGIKRLRLYVRGGKVKSVTVDMGKAALAPRQVPVLLEGERVVARPVQIEGNAYEITCVSMGNPHCVVFRDNLDLLEIEKIGPAFESAPIFPEQVNTEFVQVLNSHTLKMRVWERGSGETLACGTGACAAVVAAVENGFCQKGEDITVRLRGGELLVRYTDETVRMTGDARKNFEGVAEL